jgi:class 2 POU domain transcription factor
MGMSGQNVSSLHPAAAAQQQLHQMQRTQRFLQEKSPSSLVNQHCIKQETSQESSISVPNRHQKELNLPHGRQMALTQSCHSEELDRTAMNHNTSIRSHDKSLSSLTRKELISNGNQNSKSNLMTNGSATITTTLTPAVTQMPVRSRTEPSPEEMTDLEELEQFAKMFKQRRIKLGELSLCSVILLRCSSPFQFPSASRHKFFLSLCSGWRSMKDKISESYYF